MSLVVTHDDVRLDLHDDGRGLPAGGIRREGHHGLRWLAERVEGLGGRFEVVPIAPHGVHLQIALPLTPVAA